MRFRAGVASWSCCVLGDVFKRCCCSGWRSSSSNNPVGQEGDRRRIPQRRGRRAFARPWEWRRYIRRLGAREERRARLTPWGEGERLRRLDTFRFTRGPRRRSTSGNIWWDGSCGVTIAAVGARGLHSCGEMRRGGGS